MSSPQPWPGEREQLLAAGLGAELRALLAAQRFAVADVARITTLPSGAARRAAFRVTLADSRMLKARILESSERAEEVARLLQAVDDPRLSRIVARHGSAILEDWVAGEPFKDGPRPVAAYWRAGALLQSLHATPVPSSVRNADPRRVARKWRATVIERIERLRAEGMLSRRARDDLLDLVWACAPRDCRVGLAYLDFCAENIVVDERGDLFAVDSETVAVEPIDFDLARTWYRWPMRKPQREAFGQGYESRGSLADFRAHFPFWAAAVLVAACVAQIPHVSGTASRPIRLLHRLSRHSWRGAAARRAAAAREAGHYLSFGFAGTAIGVQADEPQSLAWLEEFLAPPFRAGGAWQSNYSVAMEADASAFGRMRDRRMLPDGSEVECFLLDGRLAALAAWIEDENWRVAWDPDLNAFYVVDRNRPSVRVLCNPGEIAPREALMRVVREIALRCAWRRGETILHAAALAVDGAGILLAGPKGSGKSTLLIHLLQAEGARYVSNDRTLLRPLGQAGMAVLGVPTIISLRPQTTAFFPWLRERQRAHAYRHGYTLAEVAGMAPPPHLAERVVAQPSLTPAQFCRLVGTTPVAGARFSTILFLRQAGTAADERSVRGIRLQPLPPEEAARRLPTVLFGPKGALPGGALLADTVPCVPQGLRSPEQFRGLLEGVRCFDCLLGPEAYAQCAAPELLQALA